MNVEIHDGIFVVPASRDPDEIRALQRLARESFTGDALDPARELELGWARIWIAGFTPPELTPTQLMKAPLPSAYVHIWHVADEVQILTLATAHAQRRRGLARALLSEVISFARSHRVRLVLLEVRRSNRGALALYRQLNFSLSGIRPRYYADTQEDAAEMTLRMDPTTGEIEPTHDEIAWDSL